jgi:hypothetical protein
MMTTVDLTTVDLEKQALRALARAGRAAALWAFRQRRAGRPVPPATGPSRNMLAIAGEAQTRGRPKA